MYLLNLVLGVLILRDELILRVVLHDTEMYLLILVLGVLILRVVLHDTEMYLLILVLGVLILRDELVNVRAGDNHVFVARE